MEQQSRLPKRPSSSPAPEQAQLESPSKRLKLSPTPATSLPLPLALFTQAQHLHSIALQSLPNWTEYLRYELAAIELLRTLIEGQYDGAGLVGNGRLELRGRIMLVELLGLIYGEENKGEREKLIAKGLAFSQSHQNLASFKYIFVLLQSLLSAVSNPKFSKSTLKRAISEATSTIPSSQIAWLYQLHFTLFTICIDSNDYVGGVSTMKEVEREATKRGHEGVLDVVAIIMFRTAMEKGDEKLLKSLIDGGLVQRVEKDNVDKMLKVIFWLNYSNYLTKMGVVKEAKERLKLAHQALDSDKGEEGENEGWATVTLNPAQESDTTAIVASSSLKLPTSNAFFLKVEPKPVIYCYAFLVSVAVHRDPFGTEPRALTFARGGVKEIEGKLALLEASSLPPLELHTQSQLLHSQKTLIHLFRAELDLMRSQLPSCIHHLNLAVATARTSADGSLWAKYRMRITLDFGLVSWVKGKEADALECFKVVREVYEEDREMGGEVPLEAKEMEELANLSILLLKISQGATIRSSDSIPSPGTTKKPSSSLTLDELATNLSHSTSQSGLVASFVKALTKEEIIKSKQNLSTCLKIGNDWGGQGNHLKAIVLALLANLFLLTRNDQALKMLQASFQIARGMGQRSSSSSSSGSGSQSQGFVVKSKVLSDDTVGNPRLGLWLGERLLESYKKTDPEKVQQQMVMNEAHRKSVAELLR